MAANEGSAKPKLRRKKVPSSKAQKRGSASKTEPDDDGEADGEEEENPGMLLTSFMEEPGSWGAAAGQKAAKNARKAGKAGKKKRPSAEASDDEEADLLFFGQGAEDNEGGSSARLIGAISAATSGRSTAVSVARHAEEALPENEFHAGTGGEDISIEDLLAPLQDSTGFGDVKKLLQGVSKKEAMPEPLSEPKQGREERETRYKESSNDIKKFIPQVTRMRKADQVTLGEEQDHRPNTTAALVSNFRPLDDFEKELEEVTKAAGATEEHLKDEKGLPMNSRIRDQQQTQQIARLKSLMLREQQSAKRIKKIKSKAYRRIHRKGEQKEREVLLERLERDNPELAKSLRHDYEKKHAERRMLRQRNARKKWAQTMQRFAKGELSAATEITKQAQDARDEDVSLKRVIQGRDADESDDSEAMDDLGDSDDEGGDKKRLAQRTVDKAKQLTLNELNDLKKDGDLPTTGIFGLGFMRRAIEQKRKDAQSEAQSVLNELEGVGARLDGVADSDAESADPEKAKAEESQPAKKREFTAEELEQAGKEVDLMMEHEDPTQSQGVSVSGPLTVRGVEAQPLPQRRTLNGAASGASSSSTAPAAGAAAGSRASVPSGASGSKSADNPWESAGAAGDNPWLAAASSEAAPDAATPSAPSSGKSAIKQARAEEKAREKNCCCRC